MCSSPEKLADCLQKQPMKTITILWMLGGARLDPLVSRGHVYPEHGTFHGDLQRRPCDFVSNCLRSLGSNIYTQLCKFGHIVCGKMQLST